jgi:hypothetical protein
LDEISKEKQQQANPHRYVAEPEPRDLVWRYHWARGAGRDRHLQPGRSEAS